MTTSATTRFLLALCVCLAAQIASAQTYPHPAAGLQSTFAGNCEVNLCSGVYTDDGGTGGNYANNINNIYRTFCPSAPGQCIRLTFTQFSLETEDVFGDCYDYLTIGSGPTQNSPVVWSGCGATLPPAITSTDPSGCLTMRFVSDGVVTAAGWRANITCVPCAGGGPSALLSNDCTNAQYVCDNLQPINANSQGPGLVSDACVSGCAISENYSNWFILNVTAAGTMGFTITPTPTIADYDFTLYGPVTGGCSNLGAPIRCSYAANTGATGMRSISTDASEDVNGDGWVSQANMAIGTYYLLINQWAYEPSSTFRLDFNGTSSIGLPSLNISSNSPVCDNQALQLTGPLVQGATYSWTGPSGWTSTQRSPTRNPPVAGTYNFSYTVNGCTSPQISLTVVVNPAPTPTITPTATSICPGQNTTLTANGGASYAWSNSANTQSITVSPPSTTTYTVTVTAAGGCTATATQTITVNSNLNVAINPTSAAICNGANTTLTASGGTSYTWSNSANTPSITVNPTNTTTYTVTATNGASCTGTASATVTVNANPVASVLPAAVSICNGASTTLTASGGSSYAWSNSANTQSITVNPASTTTYTVTVTNANGCTAVASGTVTVNNNPTATITPATTSLCSGQSLTLTASGGTSYAWSTTENTASITVSPTTNTTYTVTVTNAAGCTATATRTITVNTAPVAAINPAAVSICTGTSTTLTASGGTSYAWSNSANTPSTSVAPTTTTTYTVTVTNISGCTATATSTVTVNALPVATITPATASICSGASATLTANGGVSYVWNNTANTQSITVSTSGNYIVTVTDANNCTATASRTVTVHPNPAATILPLNVSLCAGASATLTASGGTSYTWSTTENTASISVTPAATTSYTVTVTDANNCTATASRTVNVNALPLVSITPSSVTICNGASTTLTASGGNSYAWSNSQVTPAITVNPATTTTYTVTATDVNSCSATASATVTVNALPVASISPSSATLCAGASATLTASGGASYAWSTSENTASITVSPSATTTYTVTTTDAGGCTAVASATVTVNQNPVAAISPSVVAICEGASTTLTASGGTSYLWSNSAITPSITVAPTTTIAYSVTVTDGNNCTATDTRNVVVNANPVVTISPTSAAICDGGSATLTANGGATYVWSNSANTQSITVNPATTTSYTVTATDANSCSATASATVSVSTIPSASVSPSAVAICNGESTTLTASGGASYVWSNSETTASISVSPISTTTYSVTVTDVSGCTATASATVTVNPNPVAVITPANLVLCEGESATLTASGGTAFAWSTTESSAAININPSLTTTYSVTVTDANNCSSSEATTVVVNLNPTVMISPVLSAICSGETTTLTASGAVSYVWNTTETSTSISVSPVATTTYSVTGTDANSCSATTSATVNVNALPNAAISPATASVCTGSSVTLTASGGTAYVWSTTENTQSITVSPLATTTYTVTVTDANSCSAVVSRDVNVGASLVVNISPTVAAICEGASTTLTASGGTSFVWSTTENTQSITVSPLAVTTYSVTASDASGCTGTASRDVTVNTNPTAVITPAVISICAGESATLDAAGGINYTWSTTEITPTITVSPSANATYSVTVTDINGCTASTTSDVSVNALPVATITPASSAICVGANTTLDADGGVSYLWSNGLGTTQTVTVSPATTTSYSVTVTDANNCTASTSESVTVNTLPTASITSTPSAICEGGSSSLSATGGTSYSWSTTEITQDIVVSPNTTSTYSVTVTDANNCTATTSSTVQVNANPLVSISPASSSICGGQNVSLNATGADTYLWSTTEAGTTITVSPFVTTTYSVTGTDANNCTGTGSATVDVLQSVSITPTADDVSCNGESDGAVNITVNGGQVPYTYLWSNGAVTQNISGVPANNYSVTVTDAINCGGTATATVTEPNAITVSATIEDVSCFGDTDGEIDITPAGGQSPYAYEWNDGDLNEDRINLSSGNYSVEVMDANSCVVTADYFVQEGSILNISSIEENPSCAFNGNDGNISVDASGGVSPYSYSWSNGSNTQNNTALAPGNYTVTVSDDNGCSETADFMLTYEYVFTADAGNGVTITVGQSVTLGYTTAGNAGNIISNVWTPDASLNCGACPAPDASPDVTTLYTITVLNEEGCPATDTIRVQVVEEGQVVAPNAFTPDGDGNNDEFQIYGNLETINFFEAQIYNRWGEKVFETNDPTFKWNGVYRGELLRPDVYIYQVRLNTFGNEQVRVKKGSVTLLR